MPGSLRKRAIGDALRMQLMLGVLLFVPAGSLHYWEAWAYWVLISAAVLFNVMYFLRRDPALVKRRMKVGPTAERRRKQQVIQAVAGTLICVVIVLAALDERFEWSSVSAPMVWLSDLAVVAGLLIMFRTLQVNSYASGTVRVEPTQPVISNGPYAWVRHPMYAGSIVTFLATPLALGSRWALVPAILLCGAVVLRLVDEDRFLSGRLRGYKEYRRDVPHRLIPYVW